MRGLTYHKILGSNVIYADETPLNMRFETGYAWIFANNEEVVFFYRPTREGDFLKEYLSTYKGIPVSWNKLYNTIRLDH